MLSRCHRPRSVLSAVVLVSWITLIASPVQAVDVVFAWDSVPDSRVTGYLLSYGTASRTYNVSVDTGQATTAALSGLQAATTYYFAVLAYDASGNHSPYSNEVQFTVPDTPPPGTASPSILITAPGNGTTVYTSTLVTISATATDDVGVTTVAFYVNGAVRCSISGSPYTCAWKVPRTAPTTYRLKATATDAQGNVGTSPIVTVTSQRRN